MAVTRPTSGLTPEALAIASDSGGAAARQQSRTAFANDHARPEHQPPFFPEVGKLGAGIERIPAACTGLQRRRAICHPADSIILQYRSVRPVARKWPELSARRDGRSTAVVSIVQGQRK